MSKSKGKRRTQERPINETKAARFTRVVTPRVKKAVKAISVIGYCAGSTYEYTPEQIIQINAALVKAMDGMMSKFSAKAKSEAEFAFKA